MVSAVAVAASVAVEPRADGSAKALSDLFLFSESAMKLKRIARHLFAGPWRVRKMLPPAAMRRIEQAVADSERLHAGEIRVVVEAAMHPYDILSGKTPRQRAVELFSELRVWDTERNNGVLIYLLLADHDIEIVADRGIHHVVGEQGWADICHAMEEAFRRGEFEAGILQGISRIDQILQQHFPAQGVINDNELSNKPLVL